MTKNISRRDFLKAAGAAALSVGAASVPGCGNKPGGKKDTAAGGGEMEYRTSPRNGEKVSLLGFGCMRWPMIFVY